MSETPSYPPPYDPAPQPAPVPAGPLAKVPSGALLWAQLVGGVVTAIATFLPWATVEFEGVPGFVPATSSSGNGWDDSGFAAFLLLLIGLVVAALAAVTIFKIQIPVKLPWFTAPALTALLFLIAFIRWISVLGDVGDANDAIGFLGSAGYDASTGIGIWLVLLGSLAALAGAVLAALPQIMSMTKKSA